MNDELKKILDESNQEILDDPFALLCYKTFIVNEDGRTLMANLYNKYVYSPFTNLLDDNPKIDKELIQFKVAWRELVQKLLLTGQLYESALKKKR